ncbi:Stress-response A/B barrel domain-containing protein UP3 [Vanrija pseudolonga]|uniref:Stress-response A/B barrel domain-containing protein UP3 n=1 Tax=Vanrija pseudolonga TaxID=143232 RepID=A0AAF1BLH1_9TREE|nr:Stress-response A/B barrel domain-containing protein UP3 [Vanrija pseudolonga]
MGKIVHIVLWKLKPSINVATATAAIDALKTVPGPISAHLGPPAIHDRAKGFNYGLYSVFESREALDTYAVSEAHVKVVVENVRPNVEDVLAYDFELEQ